jgi:hypothetical protein
MVAGTKKAVLIAGAATGCEKKRTSMYGLLWTRLK